MTANEVNTRIAAINSELEIKRAELAHRTRRRAELENKQTANTDAKRKFITRIKLDINGLIEEINSLNTELWGLMEIHLPETADESVW